MIQIWNNIKKNKRIYIKIGLVIIGFILVIGLIVNLLLYMPIPTHSTTDSDWLSFWGSCFGGVIGGIMTLGGGLLSNNLLKKQFKEDKKPMLIPLNVIANIDTKDIEFYLYNVGFGVALNIEVSTRIFLEVDTGNKELNIKINEPHKYRQGLYGVKKNSIQFLICNSQDKSNKVLLNDITSRLVRSIIKGIKDYKSLANRKDTQNIIIGYVDISYLSILRENDKRVKERYNILLDVRDHIYKNDKKFTIRFEKPK